MPIADPDSAPVWMKGTALYTMLGLVTLTMAIIYLPKVTKAPPPRWSQSGRSSRCCLFNLMFAVCEKTFEWSCLQPLRQIPKQDAIIVNTRTHIAGNKLG